MNETVQTFRAEYHLYKALAEAALEQVPEAALSEPGPSDGNSLAAICWHVSGNLESRFTDFLTTDGEKPWRQREEEFATRTVTRADVMAKWNRGWGPLLQTLEMLGDADLSRTVAIRGKGLSVNQALHRSLAHTCYHVGQIVTVAHAIRGREWRYLSIPPGQTEAYNSNPPDESAEAQAKRLRSKG